MHIDLNADLGEGCGDDDAMLEVVSSASVACGGHAGDTASMHAASSAALRRGVRIGAHPSYPDRANFGRRPTSAPPEEVERQVMRQLRALAAEAGRVGATVAYVKPHGALYHAMHTDAEHAAAVVRAVSRFSPALPVLGPPHSVFLRLAAESGLRAVAEGFADRAYDRDGNLLPRNRPGAVLEDVDQVVEQALLIATQRRVRSVDGASIEVAADSICLHSDTPGSVQLATAVRAALAAAGVEVRAFA